MDMSMTNQNQQNTQNKLNQQNQPRYPKLNHDFIINGTISPDPQNILPANHRNSIKHKHFAIDAINIWTISTSDRPILQLYRNEDDILTRQSIFYHPLLNLTVSHMGRQMDCPPPPFNVIDRYTDMFNRYPSPRTVQKEADLLLESCPEYIWNYDLRLFQHIKTKTCLFGYRI